MAKKVMSSARCPPANFLDLGIKSRQQIDKGEEKDQNNCKMSVEEEVLRIHKKLSKMTSSGTVSEYRGRDRDKMPKYEAKRGRIGREHLRIKFLLFLLAGQSSSSLGPIESIAKPENRP